MEQKKRGRPPKLDKSQEQQIAEAITTQQNKTLYRDERGVRVQKYRRFKEGRDYEAVEAKEMVAIMDMAILGIEDLQTAMRNPGGRPPKYETVEEFMEVSKAYFQYISDANMAGIKLIPDVEGLCGFMGIDRVTLIDWENNRASQYSNAIKTVKNLLATCKKQLALSGKIPQLVFATDFNNNHGYTQKQELVLTPNNPLGEQKDPATIQQQYIQGTVEEE